jgi:hypothetical protein
MPHSKLTELNYDIYSTDEMCGPYTTHGEDKESMQIIGQENWKEEYHLENVGIYGRIILKQILHKLFVRMHTILSHLSW